MMEAIKKIELPKLSSRAVLGSLTIGVWGGERVDDKQTSRVIKSNNAAQNSARVNQASGGSEEPAVCGALFRCRCAARLPQGVRHDVGRQGPHPDLD